MLRVVWELRDGGLRFTELRSRAGGLSQSVLVTRLGELTGAGLVRDDDGSYALTARGRELADEVRGLADWVAADAAPDAVPAASTPQVVPATEVPPASRPTPGNGRRPRPRPARW